MENICSEIIFLIFTKINKLEDKINFALSCNYIFNTFVSNGFRLNITLDTDNKYYTNILVNLISHYHYSTSRLKITNSSNLRYLTKQVLLQHDFAYIVLPNLIYLKPCMHKTKMELDSKAINYEAHKIISTYIETRKERINEINYSYEFTVDPNNCIIDHLSNNLHDDKSADFRQDLQIKSYDIPWYVTQINFNLDYLLVHNIKEMNDINDVTDTSQYKGLNNDFLHIYSSSIDFNIVYNCLNPKTDFDNWVLMLKSKYSQLKTIKISSKIIDSRLKNQNEELPKIIHYKTFNDPVLRYKLFEIGCATAFITITCLIIVCSYYFFGKT